MLKKVLSYLVPVAICFLVGGIAAYLQSDAVENWYPLLKKSPLSPPNWTFPLAWGFLYVCMGLSVGLIIDSRNDNRMYFIRLFAIQLVFNFMWSIFFFYLENPLLGMLDIILLDILILLYAVRSYPLFRLSSLLFIPYIVWVTFAAYLNLYILIYNPTGA